MITLKPNILFITIDSLRADRCYGKIKTSKTPNIDKLIKNGIYFSQAFSTADQTGTSISSLFTGAFPIQSGTTQFNFSEKTQTYFNILKQNGYQTGCFIPDLEFFLNLTSDFDEKNHYIFEKKEEWKKLGDGIGDEIVNKLKAIELSQPWIYYIHIMDIRKPFPVPKEFDKEEFGETKYDRLVSYVDMWLGRFLAQVNLQNTIVVISSDHGEYIPITGEEITEIPKIQKTINSATKKAKFTERAGLKSLIFLRFVAQTYRKEKLKHTLTPYEMRSFNTRAALDLYDETINIPLIFSGANIKSHKIIPELVRHVDVFPTLTELINLENSMQFQNGRSLVPLINGEKLEELPAYIEVGINLAQLIDKKNIQVQGKIIGLRTSEYKYLRDRNDKNKHVRLFNLKDDPLEENNIAEKNIEVVNDMEKILTELKANKQQNKTQEISEDEIKKAKDILMKLGYI